MSGEKRATETLYVTLSDKLAEDVKAGRKRLTAMYVPVGNVIHLHVLRPGDAGELLTEEEAKAERREERLAQSASRAIRNMKPKR